MASKIEQVFFLYFPVLFLKNANVEYIFKIYLCKTKFYILVFILTQV